MLNLKLVSAVAGGIGYGALVGWALTADYYERIQEPRIKALENRVELLRERAIRAEAKQVVFNQYVQNDTGESDPEKSPGGVTDEDNGADEGDVPPGESPEETRTRLQGLIDTYTEDPDAQDQFVNTADRFQRDDTPPFVISRELFAHDELEGDNYAKLAITYYPRHRVLLDDEDEPVDDVANTVGWKNLKQFGGESGDPDTVFVRNRRLLTDFEVIKDEESDLPHHVQLGMGKEEYRAQRAAGLIRAPSSESD
jgi:hypothetical protein